MHCAGVLKAKPDHAFECSECGAELYDNPKAAAAAFIVADGRLIFGTRAREPHKGKLDCLGGFLDHGESFEEALIRELKEEGGIQQKDIARMEYLTSVHDVYPWWPEEEKVASAYFVIFLHARVNLHADDDIAEIVYKNTAEVDSNEFAWVGMKEAYKKLQKFMADNS